MPVAELLRVLELYPKIFTIQRILCTVLYCTVLYYTVLCYHQGLEGRSNYPVALLLDALQKPEADLGLKLPSLLEWRHHEDRAVDHLVGVNSCAYLVSK